jgi:acetyl esterase/lipase
MKRLGLLLALCGVVALIERPAAMIPEQVKIETGLLSGTVGTTQPTVRAFKAFRLRHRPSARTAGRRRSRRPSGTACGRPTRLAPRARPALRLAVGGGRGPAPGAAAPGAAAPQRQQHPRLPARAGRAEDCLYANVWTSATSANDKRPVMVWIYGGGFTGGSGGLAWYDGEGARGQGSRSSSRSTTASARSASSRIPNWRRKPAIPGSGNYGMMDAIAMLQWVKRNIAAFGGDPSKVTIAGESAGAIMVGALVGSPQSKGLFVRAIAQSGGWMGLQMNKMQPGLGGRGQRREGDGGAERSRASPSCERSR